VAPGSDEIRFTNLYGRTLFVAYMRVHAGGPRAGREPWEVRGWISLEPEATEVRANPSENQWFYYFAEAVDGAIWAGPHVVEVTDTAFTTGSGLGHSGGWQPAGMRVLDTVKYSGVVFV
jgi:hypothetical protein